MPTRVWGARVGANPGASYAASGDRVMSSGPQFQVPPQGIPVRDIGGLGPRIGPRNARRLQEASGIWPKGASARGTPRPNPFWVDWGGPRFSIWSSPSQEERRSRGRKKGWRSSGQFQALARPHKKIGSGILQPPPGTVAAPGLSSWQRSSRAGKVLSSLAFPGSLEVRPWH